MSAVGPLRTPSVHRSGSESVVPEGTILGSDRFGEAVKRQAQRAIR
jgi:hypothetical protein